MTGSETDGDGIKAVISSTITEFVQDHRDRDLWRPPIVGYADIRSDMVRDLCAAVGPDHMMPHDVLPDATVVISYFIPFAEKVGNSNVRGTHPSEDWVRSYAATNDMAAELNRVLVGMIRNMGFDAAAPEGTGMDHALKSTWSQRHLARAAGLGTFGRNNMLISELGCCGRYFSVVARIPVTPDVPKGEMCLGRRGTGCAVCVERCPSGALTVNGFDRRRCLEWMQRVSGNGADICGKCVTGLPCSFRCP